MLTKKQLDLLELIHRRMQRDGVPPSFDEMKDALDLRSKSGIHRLITGLEERGFIRRLPHRARALEVLKLPDTIADAPAAPTSGEGFSPNVVHGEFGQQRVAYSRAYREAKTAEERLKVRRELYPQPEKLADKFLALAKEHSDDPIAVQSLSCKDWIPAFAGMTLNPALYVIPAQAGIQPIK